MSEFDKGGKVFSMMGDFYQLMKKYFVLDPKNYDLDSFWDALIEDTEKFCLKHATATDKFATMLAAILIDHAEDQERGRGTLCDVRLSHSASAVFRFFEKEFGKQ